MKNIVLEGELGEKFGREWKLDVRTPAEAIRAISANAKGFIQELAHSHERGVSYRVMLNDEDIPVERIPAPFSGETFTLVPVISGGRGEIKAIIGIIIIIAAVWAAIPTGGGSLAWGTEVAGGLFTAGSMAIFGAALVAGGIAQMMASDPKVESGADSKGSYLFNGPVNTIAQGGPVPIGYGRLIVGSILISGGIKVNSWASEGATRTERRGFP